jgi:recombinational DNA repair protein RecT
MSNQLTVIEKALTSKDVTNQLTAALGLDPEDEKSKTEAFAYASSVLAEIKKTAGDKKRDLTVCSPDSICQAMIDAAQFQIAIDGKQHAHLVKYGNKATLQIGYRGYIAKITEHFEDADFTAEAVFKDDVLNVTDDGGYQSYTLEKADPFADGWDNLTGVLVRMSYTKGGDKYQKITLVSKGDLTKIRGVAKQDFIWRQWPIEKAKAAAIKRACKIQFSDVMGLQEMVKYDNEHHFDVSKKPEASPTRSSIIDNINKANAPEHMQVEEVEDDDDVIDVDVIEEDTELVEAGAEAASLGTGAYKEWFTGLTNDEKKAILDRHEDWKVEAAAADEQEDIMLG